MCPVPPSFDTATNTNDPLPRRASLPTALDSPTHYSRTRHLPSMPHIQMHTPHLPHLPSFHLTHIRRPKPVRRNTVPANLKIQCSSGPVRRTHNILSTCTSRRRGTIHQRDVFVCSDGVNAARLLALSREAMDNQVQCWGGNAIVDEAWSYTIRQCKSGHGPSFKVSITYTGVVAQCDRPDPHVPVAIEEAKGIPGLMTVISRQ